jgi:hypothetical protein
MTKPEQLKAYNENGYPSIIVSSIPIASSSFAQPLDLGDKYEGGIDNNHNSSDNFRI